MEDRDYYYLRAEEELDRARKATLGRVVDIHYQLAGLYLDRVYGPEGDPRAELRGGQCLPPGTIAPPNGG